VRPLRKKEFFLNGRTTKTSAEGENTIGCMCNLDLLMVNKISRCATEVSQHGTNRTNSAFELNLVTPNLTVLYVVVFSYTVILRFDVHGSVHRKYIPIYVQQDATLHSLFIWKLLYKFRVLLPPIIRNAYSIQAGWELAVSTQPGQRPVTTCVYKPEAANTVWSS